MEKAVLNENAGCEKITNSDHVSTDLKHIISKSLVELHDPWSHYTHATIHFTDKPGAQFTKYLRINL